MSSHPDLALSYPAGSLPGIVRWDAAGLVPVVTQDHRTGEVLMVAHANAEAVACTLATKLATYFSRSRGSLWLKGATSGYLQAVREVRIDCDGDVLLYLVESDGPACHTGRRSCFSWRVDEDASVHCDRPVLVEPHAINQVSEPTA
jgi:phosphoribosyl-AMP cyclohydrolase